MHCTALHCTALHCTALHCTALHCTALHYTALHYTTLHYTALHYTALHYTSLHFTTLHCTALHSLHCTSLHFTTLLCTSLHCNVLCCPLPQCDLVSKSLFYSLFPVLQNSAVNSLLTWYFTVLPSTLHCIPLSNKLYITHCYSCINIAIYLCLLREEKLFTRLYRVSDSSCHPPKNQSPRHGGSSWTLFFPSPHVWDSDFLGGGKKNQTPCK